MNHIIILHGTKGHPLENWFPWLASELRGRGHQVSVPWFPTPAGQSLESWRKHFETQVGSLSENSVIVAHSLGCAFALYLLEASGVIVTAAVLVGGFVDPLGIPEFDHLNRTFVDRRVDWHRVRSAARRVRLLLSSDDPYVPLSLGLRVGEGLDITPDVLSGAGHMNSDAGFSEFPLLLGVINELLSP